MRAYGARLSGFTFLLGAALLNPACPAWATDIQFRIIPLLTPSTGDVASNTFPVGIGSLPSRSSWTAEIWGSDLRDSTYGATGLIAAYLDVFYTPAVFPSAFAHHSSLFPAFLGTEPTIDLAQGRVLNLGGVTPRLDLPQGIGPEWVRIGWIQFAGIELPSPTNVHLTGRVGAGGIGCYGRTCGDVQVVGSDVVITPDPLSGMMCIMALSIVSCFRRRNEGIARSIGRRVPDLTGLVSDSAGLPRDAHSTGPACVRFA